MKSTIGKSLMMFLGLGLSTTALAKGISNDFDTLGGNQKIIDRAKALNSSRTVRVVQNRIVDRRLRLEIGGQFSGVAGGDSYLSSNSYGGQLEFHIIPQLSIGARYNQFNNQLTGEGQRQFQKATQIAANDGSGIVPKIDYPESSTIGTLTWYPIYGKLNMFDMGVTQFDLYLTGGYGTMKLSSGNTPTYTAGGGVGFWLAKHVSTRFELRWQGYKDQMPQGARQLDLTVATVTLGFLL